MRRLLTPAERERWHLSTPEQRAAWAGAFRSLLPKENPMQQQTSIVDRQGVINPAAVADPRHRTRTMALALGLTADFRCWLELNWPIWDEFQKLADKMRLTGRTYYSARAVLHVLRWHRALKDSTEPVLKINNNRSAELARLYNGVIDQPFFHTREFGGRIPEAARREDA